MTCPWFVDITQGHDLGSRGADSGKIAGPDPREMAKAEVVVIWGTNPVNTQVNVMTHATRARKERGAKIIAVDIYQNGEHELVLKAELPDMTREDIEVTVANGTLTIKGEKKAENKAEKKAGAHKGIAVNVDADGLATAGPRFRVAKYFSTSAFACAGSMSPTMARLALFGA